MSQEPSASDVPRKKNAPRPAFTRTQAVKFIVLLIATLVTGWGSFHGQSFDLLVYIMFFCISLGGTIGALNDRTLRGCLLGFAGFILGLVVFTLLAAPMNSARE